MTESIVSNDGLYPRDWTFLDVDTQAALGFALEPKPNFTQIQLMLQESDVLPPAYDELRKIMETTYNIQDTWDADPGSVIWRITITDPKVPINFTYYQCILMKMDASPEFFRALRLEMEKR